MKTPVTFAAAPAALKDTSSCQKHHKVHNSAPNPEVFKGVIRKLFKINHTKAAPERQKNTEATCTGTWQAQAAESWDLVLLPAWLRGGRALALSCHWVPPQDSKSATELLLDRGFNLFKDLRTLTLSPHSSKHTV